ncbi:flagellar export protein FliJ [Amphritea sp. 1_MG-2023]|uniref:flagellar export protein FliJ n=1 Tax=Amphritea sp. 1_MG-2023 TaxID=3062670 RepID=UPI0026E21186|nr:flagellar export protein FliJ [Amphritea sp. 1_MG-2023]MDO6564680.1 flagellar export protein FliJ [Amphritea sp. 1_MG-2023]
MKRSKRLQVVLDLAERKRKQADQWLSQSQAKVQQGEATLAQLQSYYADYANSFYEKGASGVSPGQIHTHQAFMQKLRVAAEQQENALKMDRQQLEQVTTHWQSAYQHFKSVEMLVEKLKGQESKEAERQLQKELDERSQLIRPPLI